MTRLRWATCTLALLIVLPLAACGGDGDDGEADGGGQEEFIAEVDAICADTGRQVKALYAAEGQPDSNETLEAFLKKRLPISEQAQSQAQAVEPPDELAEEYDAYLAERERLIALLTEQREAAAAGDGRTAIQIDGELIAQAEDLHAAADAVGLQTCADRPPPD